MTTESVSRLFAYSIAEFSSEDFLLSGNVVPDIVTRAETIAASYAVFDARLMASGVGKAEAALGRVELVLYQRSLLIEGLSRMEIAPGRRQRGAGRRLIQALAATAPDCRLNVYDIRPAALDFWIALGCSFRPRPGGWDGSYVLPVSLRPRQAAPRADRMESDRVEEAMRA
jgi:hypothetical protein